MEKLTIEQLDMICKIIAKEVNAAEIEGGTLDELGLEIYCQICNQMGDCIVVGK